MKQNSEPIDNLIKQALSKEEAEFYDKLDEQGLTDMMIGLYSGKLKWLSVLITIVMAAMFGTGIWCLVQFLETTDAVESIRWAAAVFGCLCSVGMLKLFSWMQIDKNAVMREIKRLELQVSALATRLNS